MQCKQNIMHKNLNAIDLLANWEGCREMRLAAIKSTTVQQIYTAWPLFTKPMGYELVNIVLQNTYIKCVRCACSNILLHAIVVILYIQVEIDFKARFGTSGSILDETKLEFFVENMERLLQNNEEFQKKMRDVRFKAQFEEYFKRKMELSLSNYHFFSIHSLYPLTSCTRFISLCLTHTYI